MGAFHWISALAKSIQVRVLLKIFFAGSGEERG
jgi:hypothetical protein